MATSMNQELNESIHYDTLAPGAISDELQPVIDDLELGENCQQLASEGWTVIEKPATGAFNDRLKDAIKETGGGNMLLGGHPAFAEAVLNPYLMAIAEFSVGRGFLLRQVAASIRGEGAPAISLHSDHNWVPAPFPEHNLLLTACWACTDFTRAGGATLIIPGSNTLRRHPTADEEASLKGAVPIECPAGSIALWDGNIWHANYPREQSGQRVVCHITYSRLMMRPVENYNYTATGDELVAQYGARMSQLLGREDLLDSANGADFSKLRQTFNNAKR